MIHLLYAALAVFSLAAAFALVVVSSGLGVLLIRVAELVAQRVGEARDTRITTQREKDARLDMPSTLREWIDVESEEFAREELEQEAVGLFDRGALERGDWRLVEERMRERHGRDTHDPDEAREIAWGKSKEEAGVAPERDGAGYGWKEGPAFTPDRDEDDLDDLENV